MTPASSQPSSDSSKKVRIVAPKAVHVKVAPRPSTPVRVMVVKTDADGAPVMPHTVFQEEEKRLRAELEASVRAEMETTLRAELVPRLRSELMPRLVQELEPQIRARLEPEIRAELEPRLRAELEAKVRAELEPRLRVELGAGIRAQLEPKIRAELEPRIRAEWKPLPREEARPAPARKEPASRPPDEDDDVTVLSFAPSPAVPSPAPAPVAPPARGTPVAYDLVLAPLRGEDAFRHRLPDHVVLGRRPLFSNEPFLALAFRDARRVASCADRHVRLDALPDGSGFRVTMLSPQGHAAYVGARSMQVGQSEILRPGETLRLGLDMDFRIVPAEA